MTPDQLTPEQQVQGLKFSIQNLETILTVLGGAQISIEEDADVIQAFQYARNMLDSVEAEHDRLMKEIAPEAKNEETPKPTEPTPEA